MVRRSERSKYGASEIKIVNGDETEICIGINFVILLIISANLILNLHLKNLIYLTILIQRSWGVIIPAATDLGSMSAASTVVL